MQTLEVLIGKGDKLWLVVVSVDNGICWMRELPYDILRSGRLVTCSGHRGCGLSVHMMTPQV